MRRILAIIHIQPAQRTVPRDTWVQFPIVRLASAPCWCSRFRSAVGACTACLGSGLSDEVAQQCVPQTCTDVCQTHRRLPDVFDNNESTKLEMAQARGCAGLLALASTRTHACVQACCTGTPRFLGKSVL